jgi:Tfp pilus assembly protein PilX
MKNQFLFFCVLCTFLFLISCGETKKPEAVEEAVSEVKADTTNSAQDTISLAKFNKWTNAWVQGGQAYTATTLTRYYTMPVIDLAEVLGETPAAARFYQGLDTSVTPNVPHLLLVGVDANGNDMLDYSAGQYVYDVSHPCPPKCGK